MSKSLKKLIDINRLREFKNKLVGTGSAYVQTGAVDQTIAGTKTFSKPIAGSVTGSSGSCTGNAATATRADSAANADTATNANYANSAGSATNATNATNAAKLGNIASSGYVQTGEVDQTIDGTKTFSAAIASSVKTNSYIDGNKGVAIINSTAPAGYNMLYRIKSTNGVFTGGVYLQSYELHYTVDTTIAANINAVTHATTLMDEAGDAIFGNNIFVIGTINGNLNGNASSANYATNANYADSAGNGVPAGVIIPFAGAFVPTGYLLCNGAAVSRTNYANLFAAIGTLYGAGDGSTTFNLPDARDRVLQGASGTHSVGSYIAAGLPNITGWFLPGENCASIQYMQGAFYPDSAGQPHAAQTSDGVPFPAAVYLDASRASTIYGASSTVQSPAIATNFIIKY